jgi:choline dehydrogenase-like flavoprotein
MTPDRTYDVVIVGAGIAGAIVGRQLAESGKTVLILEAGPGTGLERGGFRQFVRRFYTEFEKVPNSPFAHSVGAPAPSVLDALGIPGREPGYFVQAGPHRYTSSYARMAGGTTLHWLGTCLRMLPNDFRMQTAFGVGCDWPISYADLLPYYEKAEWEIGVSADVKDQEFLEEGYMFRKGYEYPMMRVPYSYWDLQLAEHVDGLEVEVDGTKRRLKVTSTPAGRNAEPRDALVDPRYPHRGPQPYRPVGSPDDPDEAGQRCEGNSNCVPICPAHAKYSALKTLRNALDHNQGRLEVRSHSVASEIEIDRVTGRVAAIRYKHYKDPAQPVVTEHTARGHVFVIAAHAIETAKLLLASHVANSSGMVGRNLMDHPYMLTWGLMPYNVGSYRGPGSTSGIPQLRDGAFRSRCAAFLVEVANDGWTWPKQAPYTTVNDLVDPRDSPADGLFGVALRDRIADVGPRHIRFGFGFEQLPDPENRVTIDSQHMDEIGNYRPVIHYSLSEYTKIGMVEAMRVSDRIFDKLHAKDETAYDHKATNYFMHEGRGFLFEGPGHGGGTHRMGIRRSDSVVNPDQRTWDHENLYLVGCGNFCTMGTSNPTLTLAALAFKAAKSILRELR